MVQEDFGDPSHEEGTPYKLCVYDDQRLVAGFEVDRAGESCGDRECWHPKRKDRGWRYKDPDASSDGTHILDLKGGREGKSRLLWTARNDVGRGQDFMPTELAAAFENSDRVSVQLIAGEVPASSLGALSDQTCFLRTFTDIEKQDSDWFRAR